MFRIVIVLTEVLHTHMLSYRSATAASEYNEDVKNAFGRNAEQILTLVILMLP
jgi:hypothetical protein